MYGLELESEYEMHLEYSLKTLPPSYMDSYMDTK